ncbi:MAG: hypothetical protein GOV02_00565 [Candidatus Aenigmarchaeota archaeon]|nr:hypothetical protein [Candidatus Aenigmarchaeota archaeon]
MANHIEELLSGQAANFEKKALDYELSGEYLNATVEYRIAAVEYADSGNKEKAEEMMRKSDEMDIKNKNNL